MPLLLNFDTAGDGEAIIKCALAEILCGTAMQSEFAMEQFFRKGPLEAFAKCLHQDIPPQYMNDWYRANVSIRVL